MCVVVGGPMHNFVQVNAQVVLQPLHIFCPSQCSSCVATSAHFLCKSMLELCHDLCTNFVQVDAQVVLRRAQKCVSWCAQKNVSWREAHFVDSPTWGPGNEPFSNFFDRKYECLRPFLTKNQQMSKSGKKKIFTRESEVCGRKIFFHTGKWSLRRKDFFFRS